MGPVSRAALIAAQKAPGRMTDLQRLVNLLRLVAYGYGPLHGEDGPKQPPLCEHLGDGNRHVRALQFSEKRSELHPAETLDTPDLPWSVGLFFRESWRGRPEGWNPRRAGRANAERRAENIRVALVRALSKEADAMLRDS